MPVFYRENRSRGRRAWTNHPPGAWVPLGGVGRGGVTPSPLPRRPTRPRGERQQETIKQIEPRGGSSIMNPEQEKLLEDFEEFELDLEVEEILKKVKADRVPDQGVTQFAQQLEERDRQKRTAQID